MEKLASVSQRYKVSLSQDLMLEPGGGGGGFGARFGGSDEPPIVLGANLKSCRVRLTRTFCMVRVHKTVALFIRLHAYQQFCNQPLRQPAWE